MKHLLSSVAVAALLTAGLPALAQTSGADKQAPTAQSGTPATGATTSMPAGTDSARSGSGTGATSNAPTGPAKPSKAPAAADAQSGTSATGAKASMPAGTDNAQSGATTPPDSMGASSKQARKRSAAGQHETSASDNMADELNRQELQRVQSGGQTTGSGQSQAPGASGTR
jgi:hypothetical protein